MARHQGLDQSAAQESRLSLKHAALQVSTYILFRVSGPAYVPWLPWRARGMGKGGAGSRCEQAL
jgi:hypothetical protein